MNKLSLRLLCASIFLFSAHVSAVESQQDEKAPSHTSKPVNKAEQEEKYQLLQRDQMDNSNTLAIPFDDSEVEDEEDVDRLEGKDAFSLPHSH